MLRVFRVTGKSMEPTLYESDYVLACRHLLSIRLGRMVVVKLPNFPIMIKRINKVDSSLNRFRLQGDNASQSLPSDSMGWCTKEHILGVVFFCIKNRKPSAL